MRTSSRGELITKRSANTGVVAREEVLRGGRGRRPRPGPQTAAVPAGGDRPAGEIRFEADLVVACDGVRSPIRDMAACRPRSIRCRPRSPYSPKQADVARHGLHGDGGTSGCSPGTRAGRLAQLRRVGAEAALDVTVDQIKEMWTRLLPGRRPSRCHPWTRSATANPAALPGWWKPGIVLIGDAAPSGPGPGARASGRRAALAEAIRQNPNRCGRPATCTRRGANRWCGPTESPIPAASGSSCRDSEPRPRNAGPRTEVRTRIRVVRVAPALTR